MVCMFHSRDGKMVVEYDGLHPASKEQKGAVELTAARHDLRVEFFQGGGRYRSGVRHVFVG